MSTAASRGVLITVQNAATTGNGLALAIPSMIKKHTFYIEGSAGVTAGAVQVEASNDPDYTGTWDAQGPPVLVTASTQDTVGCDGVSLALRARISTPIVGGTVTVTYFGA